MNIPLESPAPTTVGDLMKRPELQISDDVVVDTAMDILNSSGAAHLLVQDDEGRCAGLLTRVHLAPFQSRSWYTERTPVRDVAHDRGPFATADMPVAAAAAALAQPAHARVLRQAHRPPSMVRTKLPSAVSSTVSWLI